jgi:uncharacterized membrane protein
MRVWPLAFVAAITACHYEAYIPTEPPLPVYSIQSLGVLAGGTESQANAGTATTIVGWATDGGGTHHAVTFAGGQVTRLSEPAGAVASEARGVNTAGIIVGVATLTGGVREAMLWASATAAPIQLPGLGGAFSSASGINNGNTVVGVAQTDTGDTVLVLWQPSGATYAASPWDSAGNLSNLPVAINDNGDLAGNLAADSGAFFWDNQDSFNDATPPAGVSVSNGLNAYGIEVGGITNGSSPSQAYVYTVTNSLVVMGGPPSGYTSVVANSISNQGFVAGTASTTGGASVAVVGTIVNPTAPFATIPSLGGTVAAPANNGMTACGVILGSATSSGSTSPVAVAWVPKGCSIP